MKKRVLFVYSTMMLGGSTTSLLSLLQNFDYEKYQVDLLLYKAEGPFIIYQNR
jgi:thymidine kinase